MHNLNAYLSLTTTILVSGVTILTVNPAEAATWSRTLYVENDSYSHTNNPGTNFGSSDFIQVGNVGNGFGSGDEQRGYLSWNLDDVIAQIPMGSQVRNVSARLIMTQSGSDPDNLNDPNRPFSGVARVTLDGLEVTGNWDESSAINPANPPGSINAPTLFSGQIDEGVNRYSGVGFNRLITNILNSNLNGNPNDDRNLLSVALKANNSLNFPDFGFFPVDSFWSQNQDDINLRPRLELNFDVWDEAYRIEGGPNFAFFGRAGGDSNVNDNNSNGDWEVSLGTKSIENGRNRDNFMDQRDPDRQLTWESGIDVPFELTCNTQTNLVTLTLDNDSSQSTSFTANNCQDIDGLKIFAQARQTNKVGANTNSRIRVNQVREIGGTIQNVSGLSALARAGGTQFVEDNFYFLDSVANGGLGFTNGIDLMRGTIRMAWPSGTSNPQAENTRSHIQTQLIPLKRIDDPTGSNTPQSIPIFSESEPVSEPACTYSVPDPVWSAMTADDSNFVVDDSICSSNQVTANNQTVPEPTSILGLLLLGSTGIGVRLLKSKKTV
ncbi:MAG: PEP-CTERM sorting domain-containing protein [Crocosphaera sp.]|nr:PEP-CTERM sorting domain-containing protein [Crocosphaera sp.]